MKTNVIPMSAFQIYVATDADVPGKDGASADLIKRFNDMPRGAFVFVEDDPTLLYYKGSGASYLSGNRIELVATGAGGFVPPNDNLTDLGDSTHRFRSLYLGTSILNAGNLEVDCSGATDRTLQIHNSGAGVLNVTVDGSLTVGANAVFYQRAGGEANIAIGATEIVRASATKVLLPDTVSFLADESVKYQRFAAGEVRWLIGGGGVLELNATAVAVQIPLWLTSAFPEISTRSANAGLTITPNGTGSIDLRGGDSTVKLSVGTDGFALYNGTRVPRAAAIPNPAGGGTVDAECRAAVEAILTALRGGTGINCVAP